MRLANITNTQESQQDNRLLSGVSFLSTRLQDLNRVDGFAESVDTFTRTGLLPVYTDGTGEVIAPVVFDIRSREGGLPLCPDGGMGLDSASPSAPLGREYESFPVSVQKLSPKEQQFQLVRGASLNLFSLRKSLRYCGTMTPKAAVVHSDERGDYMAGFARCHSAFFCPVCAPKIRRETADVIKGIIRKAEAQDYTCFMMTVTVPHDASMDDALVTKALGMAFTEFLNRAAWLNCKRDLGAYSPIEVLEVTAPDFDVKSINVKDNGRHYHKHCIIICREFDLEQLEKYAEPLTDEWKKQVQRAYATLGLVPKNGFSLMKKYGLDISVKKYSASTLAGYVTSTAKHLTEEMTNYHETKEGRGRVSCLKAVENLAVCLANDEKGIDKETKYWAKQFYALQRGLKGRSFCKIPHDVRKAFDVSVGIKAEEEEPHTIRFQLGGIKPREIAFRLIYKSGIHDNEEQLFKIFERGGCWAVLEWMHKYIPQPEIIMRDLGLMQKDADVSLGIDDERILACYEGRFNRLTIVRRLIGKLVE